MNEQEDTKIMTNNETVAVEAPHTLSFAEKVSHYISSRANRKTILIESFVIVLIAGSTIFFLIKNIEHQEKAPQPIMPMVTEVFVPKKTDYGTTTPPGFSTSTPIEEGVTLSQSYTKEYKDAVQSSLVFPSTMTISQNLAVYEKFLNNDGWKIISRTNNGNNSVLTAEKAGDLFNVTIVKSFATSTRPLIKSHVLLGILKK